MNGALLNAGSSAMERFSAATLPDSMDKLKLPTVTARQRALERSDSIRGRKAFTLMRKGRAIRTTMTRTITTPTIFNARFMETSVANAEVWMALWGCVIARNCRAPNLLTKKEVAWMQAFGRLTVPVLSAVVSASER